MKRESVRPDCDGFRSSELRNTDADAFYGVEYHFPVRTVNLDFLFASIDKLGKFAFVFKVVSLLRKTRQNSAVVLFYCAVHAL